MATPRRLRRPPIKEALVDIYVNGVTPEATANFERSASTDLQERYPVKEPRQVMEAKFELKNPGSVIAAANTIGHVGVFFKSATRDRIVQFRRDGFTLNCLAGYTTADVLFDEALSLWAIYRRVAQPASITRLALRYINETKLPFVTDDPFSRFLTAAPEVPGTDTWGVSQFQSNILLHAPEAQRQVKMTQMLASAVPQARYVLDIEASRPGPLPSDFHVRAELDELRVLKNRVFFEMLTDEALDVIDPQ